MKNLTQAISLLLMYAFCENIDIQFNSMGEDYIKFDLYINGELCTKDNNTWLTLHKYWQSIGGDMMYFTDRTIFKLKEK